MITAAQARRNMQNGEGVSILTNIALRRIEAYIDTLSSSGQGLFEMPLEEFTDCIFKKGRTTNNMVAYFWYNIPNMNKVLPADVYGKTYEQIKDSSLGYDENSGISSFKGDNFWSRVLKNVCVELMTKPREFKVSIVGEDDSQLYLNISWEKK